MKKLYKIIIANLILLSFNTAVNAQNAQNVAVGDLAIIGLNCDPQTSLSKTFAVVALANIPPNTVINFSDKAYYDDKFSDLLGNGSEGRFSWTIPAAGLGKGTVVMFTLTSGTGPSVATNPSIGSCNIIEGWTNISSNTSPFGQNGDSMLIYVGTEASPTFIFGFNSGNSITGILNGWNRDLTSNPNGACELPATLTNGTNAIGFGGSAHLDNFRYKGTKEGTKAELLLAICNSSNWEGNDDTGYDFTPGAGVFTGTNPIFTISVSNTAPTATSVANTGILQVGQTLTGNYTYADAESNAESGSVFKWYRSDNAAGLNKAAIGSATAKTYTVVSADMGKYISFEVTPRDGALNGTAVESALRGPVIDPVLPVEFSSFTAKTEGNYAKLTWQTSSETNNKGFEIYRAERLKTKAESEVTFIKIGEQPAVRTDGQLSVSTYNFTDKQPLNGTNYYKLVQIDNDGTATELGVRMLNFGLSTSDIRLFPNPTTNQITASFATGSYTQLRVTDVTGKILQQININPTESSKIITLGQYPSGTYIISLIGKGISEIRKVVKN